MSSRPCRVFLAPAVVAGANVTVAAMTVTATGTNVLRCRNRRLTRRPPSRLVPDCNLRRPAYGAKRSVVDRAVKTRVEWADALRPVHGAVPPDRPKPDACPGT